MLSRKFDADAHVPLRRCAIDVYGLVAPEPGDPMATFGSFDELMRWQQSDRGRGVQVSHLRLFSLVGYGAFPRPGFYEYNAGVSVQYDGEGLTVTAPTSEALIEAYNAALNGDGSTPG